MLQKSFILQQTKTHIAKMEEFAMTTRKQNAKELKKAWKKFLKNEKEKENKNTKTQTEKPA